MTRAEYMEELKQKLSFLKEENRLAALSFYGEMLDDRMEDGMDEESAVSAMENPDEIAARLRIEQKAEIEAASPLHLPTRNEALEFSTLADSVMKNVEDLMNKIPNAVQKSADKAREEGKKVAEEGEKVAQQGEKIVQEAAEIIRTAVEENRQAWEESGEGKVGEYEKKVLTCSADDIDQIMLSAAEMPVFFKGCEGNEVKLTYYTSPRVPYRAQIDHRRLVLSRETDGKHRGFGLTVLFGGVSILWGQPAPTIELDIPRDALVHLTVRTSNGSIRGSDLKALCDVNLTTSNSRISLQAVKCKSLATQTSNSRTVLTQVESKQFIQCRTSNARIEAEHVRAGGDITLTASNGKGVMSNVHAQNSLSLTTSNGSITAEKLLAQAISLRTSNSSIHAILPGSQQDWAIESHTSNGKNSLPTQQSGRHPLSVRTSNGNIDVHFED